jgi:tetratricopeptide (TPR) repeat protein/transcriptional regulator with XRE-family HTH domain
MHQMKSHPLKVEREMRGWSQARVAKALGTTTRTVSRWELGLATPYPYYREQLCSLFGKTAQELGLPTGTDENNNGHKPPPADADVVATMPQASFLVDPTIPEALGSTDSLLGRDDLLELVKRYLLGDNHQAQIALNGLPGIGKTTLAVALTKDRQVQAHFCDGILWAGLGPRPNVLSVLARWGALLGIKPDDVENVNNREDWGRALQASIGNRRFLLVIDDAWNVKHALALQIGGPRCVHLLTTRSPRVASAFAQQRMIVVPELQETYGLALLARYVPQLVQDDPEDAQLLVRAVGSLPLALTLMGKYLAAQVSTGQPRRLQAALARLLNTEERLRVSMPTMPGERSLSLPENIPLSLHAVITISARQLSFQDHAALCALTVFPPKPNSFSEEAALTVCQQPVETLEALWDAGLLESSGPQRYTLHRTIADYAQTQTQDLTAQRQLVNYMLPYIQTHAQNYEALELEAMNIQATIDTSVALSMSQATLEGVIALVEFLRVRGRYNLADQYLQSALEAATMLEDPEGQTTILQHLATFAELRGDYHQAEHFGQLGLVLARQLERKDEVSALLATLGLVDFHRGEYAQATANLEEGLALAQEVGDSKQICTLLGDLGRVAQAQGNYERADAFYQEGLARAWQNEHQELVGRLLAFLGASTREQGNYDQAEQYCQEGLILAHQQGHREHLTHLLTQLGAIAYYRGQDEQAQAYFEEGLAIARQIGHRAQICRLLANLGAPLTGQGDYARAEQYLQEGVNLARELGDRDSLPFLLMNLGGAIGQQGDYDRANACFQEGIEVARQLGSPWLISAILRDWGDIHLKYQQLDAAAAAFNEVLTLTNSPGQDPYLIAQAEHGLAQIAALRGDLIEAHRLGTDSMKRFETLGHSKANEIRNWLQSLTK